jgi:type II secretory pathway component PulC
MKNLLSRFATLTLVCTLMFTAAFAKEKSKNVSFKNDTTVNGTLIKKGTYKVTFNDETNEVSIWKEKELLVKTSAKLLPRDSEVKQTFLSTKEQDNLRVLNGIAFEGEKSMIVIDESANKAANPQ